MRRTRTGLLFLGAALALVGGCTPDAYLKPPKIDPEYVLPPDDDPRYSAYPKFPEKTLNEFKKKTPDDFTPPSMRPGRPRAGFGAGGPGG